MNALTRAFLKIASTAATFFSDTCSTAPGCSLKSVWSASPPGSFAMRPRPPVIAISASVTARPPSERSWYARARPPFTICCIALKKRFTVAASASACVAPSCP